MCIAGKGIQLVQKKKTIYPEWNTCFDAHLYEGRMIQMVVMVPRQDQPDKLFADINIGAQMLADRCRGKEGNVATISVSMLFSFVVCNF